jgi:hypothetical protein
MAQLFPAVTAFLSVIIAGALSARAIILTAQRSLLLERLRMFEAQIQANIVALVMAKPTASHTNHFQSHRLQLLIMIDTAIPAGTNLAALLSVEQWDTEDDLRMWQADLLKAAHAYNISLMSVFGGNSVGR